MAQQIVTDKNSPAETHSLMILTTSERMRDAFAADDKEKFYRYFTSALQMLSPAMSFVMRQRIEDDQKKLMEVIKKIYEDKDPKTDNETSKKERILNCQFAFAERHMLVVYSTMARTDMFRPRAEGSIDFTKYDIEILAEAVRQKGKNDSKEAIDILKGEKSDKLDERP